MSSSMQSIQGIVAALVFVNTLCGGCVIIEIAYPIVGVYLFQYAEIAGSPIIVGSPFDKCGTSVAISYDGYVSRSDTTSLHRIFW
jgi:hypothetical protein